MKKRLPRLADDVLPKLPLQIRPLSRADSPALLDYYRHLPLRDRSAHFGHPLSDALLARYVDQLDFQSDGHFAALGAASLFIGVGHCMVVGGQGLLSIHVVRGYRRRGLGSGLRRQLIGFGRSRQLDWVRAYFSRHDDIATMLARGGGMEIQIDYDRFYAELSLARGPAARGARLQSTHGSAVARPTSAAPA